MAVRVRIRIRGPKGKAVETVAVLNGGFEASMPHLLLPAGCARRLFGNYRSIAVEQEMEAAGGVATLLALAQTVNVEVVAGSRKGPERIFRVLVSEADREVLVSDTGIDELGVHIESFSPGRWRLSGEDAVHDSEAAHQWPTGGQPPRRKRKRS